MIKNIKRYHIFCLTIFSVIAVSFTCFSMKQEEFNKSTATPIIDKIGDESKGLIGAISGHIKTAGELKDAWSDKKAKRLSDDLRVQFRMDEKRP